MTNEIKVEQDGNSVQAISKKGLPKGALCLLATGTFASLLTLGAASYVLTKTLVSVALDREMPRGLSKSKRMIEKAIGNEEMMQKRRAAAEILCKKEHQVLYIKAYDRERLIGHYFPHPSPRRLVIAMHGWRSSWASDFGAMANFFHACGCSVLYAEQRGQNGSGGAHMTFGMTERYDCRSWVEEMAGRVATVPIYLVGVSMGGATVLMAAGLPLSGRVKGIVADCAFTSAEAIWSHVLKTGMHLSYRLRARAVGRLCQKKICMAAGGYTTLEAMRQCKVPVLFIHGAADSFVPISMTYENYLACRSEKQLLVVPGAGHGVSYLCDRAGYERALTDFFARHDEMENCD